MSVEFPTTRPAIPDDGFIRAPKLLVSVRNAREAAAAVAGGCGILDIKDPDRGALGFAGEDAIKEVVAVVRSGHAVEMSVAAGEVLDWTQREAPTISDSVLYVKLGLAGLAHHSDYVEPWMDVRRRIEAKRKNPPLWIAVAYADSHAAHAPAPSDVLKSAIRLGCHGFLIDTWQKSATSVFDFLSHEQLRSHFQLAHREGLVTGLAGRLRSHQIDAAVLARPRIIGVRSAACRAGDRHGEVEAQLVRDLRELIHATTSNHNVNQW